MNNNAAITVEEYENSCFGAEYGICQFPSMSHSEIASLQQSLINEDYGLNIYADAMDGSFPSPSAINNIEMTNLETYMSGPYDDYGRTGICPGPIYTKSVQVKEKNALGKSLKKTVLGSTKTVNMSAKQVLKAYSIVHPSASKDGHTKVATSRGPRDRRIRLSFQTALKFFLVQDRLGFDQPSKALEWLLEKCRPAIDELPTISPPLTDVDCSMGTDQWAIENLGLVAQPSSTVQVQQPISLNNTQV